MSTIRIYPVSDNGPNDWMPSAGGHPHYTLIDDPYGSYNDGDKITALSVLLDDRFGMGNMPSDFGSASQIEIPFRYMAVLGSAINLGLDFRYYINGLYKGHASFTVQTDASWYENSVVISGLNYDKSEMDTLEISVLSTATSWPPFTAFISISALNSIITYSPATAFYFYTLNLDISAKVWDEKTIVVKSSTEKAISTASSTEKAISSAASTEKAISTASSTEKAISSAASTEKAIDT